MRLKPHPSHLWGTVAGESVCAICYAAPGDALVTDQCLPAVGMNARKALLNAAIRAGELPPGTKLPKVDRGTAGGRPRELTARERSLLIEVEDLRAEGQPLKTIASNLGVTAQSIHRLRRLSQAKALKVGS